MPDLDAGGAPHDGRDEMGALVEGDVRGKHTTRPSPDVARNDLPEHKSYDEPESYRNLDGSNDIAATTSAKETRRSRRRASAAEEKNYTTPDRWANLDEVAATSPVENVTDGPVYRHQSLEDTRSREQENRRMNGRIPGNAPGVQGETTQENAIGAKGTKTPTVSSAATQLYTLSYLVFFSMLGTLARIGLTALTTYPGAPLIFNTVWANFGGSLVMGFLAEDRMLFRNEWGTPTYDQQITRARQEEKDEEGADRTAVDLPAAKKAHLTTKKTIPLYIGLATGFCGSFTSFSSFIRDIFLALSNDMVVPGVAGSPTSRNGGYSFMALLAVTLTTVSLSLSGLYVGAHLAIASEPFIPSIPYPITRKIIDRLVVVLGWGCWLGAILLSIFPPHSSWRGRATFALVFAPLGCLARFYLSLYLNGKKASFPLGTFAANVLGTAVLGMAWDIAHVPIGGVVGCQVLQGIEDGFCGCLTTISTWVAELSSLQRRHSYVYGAVSVLVSLALLIVIMGGLRWTNGFSALSCST